MMLKPVVLLAALTLCCFITELHAAKIGCLCRSSLVLRPVRPGVVANITVTPPSGRCRRVEIIIYRKNGGPICVNPKAKWLPELLKSFDE
uniref:Chemokine interleukin-8-like domain-containing protein n=1 Tax=Kryptolebias marmoratus TaxID=37003 RepID=A0A3Q2ZP51_KRYMA